MRLFRLLCLLILLSVSGFSQQFGGNPPGVKWRQVNTDSVRIIYPEAWKGNARELANLAAKLGVTQSTLGDRFRKINIVLQTGTTISNAYVGLGPRRSEFFLTPPQNSFELGSLYWPEQLMLHEFRHVQQYNNFNKGISRLFYFLAGELGLTFINSTAIPNWFWEGDAVYQETHSSIQGRGRVPYFFNGYRSLAASGKNYSWLKLRNGSLRDYVPDHYQLGYLLTAYGREKYGDSLWRAVTDDAVRFKGLFYPFQSAIKRQTGTSFRQFRRDAISFFTENLKKKEDPVAAIARNTKHFAGNEEYPQFIDDDHVVLVKSSYSEIPAFYIRDLKTGKDQFLRVKDISLDAYFSHRNGKVVYAAMGFDLRWAWQDYSELRLLDTYTGEQKTITRRTKLFSPDINEEGTQVIAVTVSPAGESTLELIGTDSGQHLRTLPNPHQYFYTHPRFFDKQKVVTAVRNRSGEMALLKVDLVSGEEETLLPFSAQTIGFPAVTGDTVLITVSAGEQEQLFLVAKEGLFQYSPEKANRSTGSYQQQWRGDKTVWVSFTAVGYRMMVEQWEATRLQKREVSEVFASPSSFGVQSLARGQSLSEQVPADKTQGSKPYNKAHRLINFHSWLPGVSDSENSLTFISENVLNTFQSELGLIYNVNDRSKKVSFTGAYGALFPWIRLGGAYTIDRRATYNNNFVYWNEAELRGGFLLPFNFSGGKTFTSLRVATDYVYAKPQFKGNYKDSFDSNGYGYLNSYITFTNQIQQARQQIYPRFAQQVRMEYYNAVTYLKGQQMLFNGSWYFPGLLRNHSLVLNTAWHGRDTLSQLRFTNSFPFSRGYSERNFHRMMKLGVNYHFPLFYPDWGFGSIVYFLRVRANAFYDFTRIKDYNQNRVLVSRDLRSFGGEVYFDTKWWNQQPISFGFRYSRLQDAALQGLSPNQWEFVLPVSLIGR